MKILKDNNIIRCARCNSYLSFEKEDVEHVYTDNALLDSQITCPECGLKISVRYFNIKENEV